VTARWAIGLTGDVGGGKSTVRGWLTAQGAAALDADAVAHTLLVEDAALRGAVVERFGASVQAAGGTIDRAALAAIVFREPAALEELERIVHPAVIAATRRWLARATAAVAVVEAVKLVESGLDTAFDALWLVVCDAPVRRRRLAERGWSAGEIDRRLAAGAPLAPRLALADVVIDNSGSWRATERQLAVAWSKVRARCAPAAGPDEPCGARERHAC